MGASSTHPSTGSSPRVRGKPGPGLQEAARRGLIPARAGKTRSPVSSTEACQAHPRVCGENDGSTSANRKVFGSSPRVRGKHGLDQGHRAQRGLIPACAGKTRAGAPIRASARAHPRVCGENLAGRRRNLLASGSSPRVRGKRAAPDGHTLASRLIPACAGKTGGAADGEP